MAEEEQTKAEAKVSEKSEPKEEKSEPKGITDETSVEDLAEAGSETLEKPKELTEKESAEETSVEQEKLVEEAPKKEIFERRKSFKRRDRAEMEKERKEESIRSWVPKTKLGKEVKAGKIKNIDEILNSNKKILEPEIVDTLIELKSDLIAIGQSKGKFGGGKRRAWRQTQRKKKEGNVPTFSAFAVVGDENGHLGIGVGKSRETLPARDKAIRKAKLNVIRIVRGDGSFDSVGGGINSVPFKIQGKSGSVRITLIPAAPGTGLVVADQLKKVLKLAGIKDVYTKTSGRLRTSFNLIKACVDALKKTNPKEKIK